MYLVDNDRITLLMSMTHHGKMSLTQILELSDPP